MKNNIKNENVLSNICVPEGLEQELIRNCKEHKRTDVLTFRYVHVLSALMALAVFGIFSIGAAATYASVKERMESMPEEEVENFQRENDKDEFVTRDGVNSRPLTDSEILRVTELERDYYDNGVFPENTIPHYASRDEMTGELPAYVEEDNVLYLPEEEMTDEQLLQYIDHNAKKWYVNEQELIAEGYIDTLEESAPVIEGSVESRAKQLAAQYIKDFYGDDVATDPKWNAYIYYTPEDEEYNRPAQYELCYETEGIGYSTGYQIWLAEDLSPMLINITGAVFDIEATRYAVEEVESRKDEIANAAIARLDELLGLGMPTEYTVEIDDYDIEDGMTGYLIVKLTYPELQARAYVRVADGTIITYSSGFGL